VLGNMLVCISLLSWKWEKIEKFYSK
jgi:hypothetical protein